MVYFCLAMYLGINSCNHTSYIVIIYYFLHGRRKLIAEIPIFASLYHLFCVLRMLRDSRAYVVYKGGVPQNVAKFTETHVCRSLFLIKLRWLQLY